MLRESAREDLPGFARDDYLDEDAFWAQAETARERAPTHAERIRAGDVLHDPKGDGCPRGATSGRCAGWREREAVGLLPGMGTSRSTPSPTPPPPTRRPLASPLRDWCDLWTMCRVARA